MIGTLARRTLSLAACSASLVLGCQAPKVVGPPGTPMRELPFLAQSAPASSADEAAGKPSEAPSDKPSEGDGDPKQRLASSTLAKGLVPLTDADGDDMTFKCKPLRDKVDDAARLDGKARSREEYLDEVLAGPLKIGPLIKERCSDLLRRDARINRAQVVENEAIENLRRIAVGMATAYGKEPHTLCPSAPPVPADLASVAKELVMSKAEDWSALGWKCAKFSLSLPQRYQYEILLDASGTAYEAVARGYPVDGTVEELYVRGEVEGGRLSGALDILRR